MVDSKAQDMGREMLNVISEKRGSNRRLRKHDPALASLFENSVCSVVVDLTLGQLTFY